MEKRRFNPLFLTFFKMYFKCFKTIFKDRLIGLIIPRRELCCMAV